MGNWKNSTSSTKQTKAQWTTEFLQYQFTILHVWTPHLEPAGHGGFARWTLHTGRDSYLTTEDVDSLKRSQNRDQAWYFLPPLLLMW